jgi:DNA polymerase-3 subunit gamma/tau
MARTQTTAPAATSPASGAEPPRYTVLARRWRSRDFDEIVGQEPTARTLRNAVATGRTAHAYLFSGTRGVGKTSMARILAKALNATEGLAQRDEIAEAILRGEDLDVIEIDGASNRRVEEARDLIAAAGVSPARCPFKIYIIDEVHMLTREAFNTLLKTMEEPPAHVKFILCTTEPNRVPATIQSRCQRFDFRSLSASEIAAHLRTILADEQVEAQEEVVAGLARLGRGSMRDALSLLDRLLATGEKTLTADLMEKMLGLPDHALVEKLVDALAGGDAADGLRAGAALLSSGATPDEALELLAEHLRQCLLVAVCGAESELLDLSPSAREIVARQAAKFDAAGLVHLIALADSVARRAQHATTARALFDAALVRMCQAEHLADVAGLLAGGASEPSAAGHSRPPVSEPAKKKEAPSAAPPLAAPADEGDRLWSQVRAATPPRPGDHAPLEHLVYDSFDGRTLRLRAASGEPGLARWLGSQTENLARLVERATGRAVTVEVKVPPEAADPTRARRALEEAERLPAVQAAMRVFDAQVVDVKETDEDV